MILIASCCGNSLCIFFRKPSAPWCEIPVCQTAPEVTSKNTIQTVSLGPVLLWLDAPVWFLSLLSTLSSHTHTHTPTPPPCLIDGRVEPLNANDSPLILIRETHQIQTTSQINRQVQGEGTGVRNRGNFQPPFFPTTLNKKLNCWILKFNQTALKASYEM